MSTPELPVKVEPQPITIGKIFGDASIQAAIDKATARIPVGHTFGVVATANLQGATLAAVVKVGDHWSVKAAAVKPWNGPLSAEGEVVASW